MKVICNRSDECGNDKCEHKHSHVPLNDIMEDCEIAKCDSVGGLVSECIEDEGSDVKPMPIRFLLADEEGSDG